MGPVAPPAFANPIERACVQSDRPGVNPSLCRCIAGAADLTLSPSDMREGARFFRDPGRAQEIQLSDTPRNDAFWSRWQQFGATAEALCS
ncbi:MAG: hypothetical protein ACOCY0_03575 [Roseicyclus sp.]